MSMAAPMGPGFFIFFQTPKRSAGGPQKTQPSRYLGSTTASIISEDQRDDDVAIALALLYLEGD